MIFRANRIKDKSWHFYQCIINNRYSFYFKEFYFKIEIRLIIQNSRYLMYENKSYNIILTGDVLIMIDSSIFRTS